MPDWLIIVVVSVSVVGVIGLLALLGYSNGCKEGNADWMER